MACRGSCPSAGFCHHKTEVLPDYEIIISILHAITGDLVGVCVWALYRIFSESSMCLLFAYTSHKTFLNNKVIKLY